VRLLASLAAAGMFWSAPAGVDANAPATAEEIQIEIDIRDQMNSMWNNIPLTGDADNVRLLGNTQPDCAATALRLARQAITRADAARGIRDVGKFYFNVAKLALKGFGLGTVGDAADIALKVLESSSPEDFAVKFGEFLVGKGASSLVKSDLVKSLGLPQGLSEETIASEAAKALYKKILEGKSSGWEEVVNAPCENITVQLWTAPTDDGLMLVMFVVGNCQCKWPTNVGASGQLRHFGVFIRRFFTPKVTIEGQTVKIGFDVAGTEYNVKANCCGEPEHASFMDPGGTGTENVSFIPGFAISSDTKEWCTYGGTTTGIPTGPGLTPGGGALTTPKEPATIPGSDEPRFSGPPPGLTSPPPELDFPFDTPKTTPQTPSPSRLDEEEKPPPSTPPTGVPIKATQTVLIGGQATTTAAAGARVRINVGSEPTLPGSGAPVMDNGFAESPLQALTGANGTATIPISTGSSRVPWESSTTRSGMSSSPRCSGSSWTRPTTPPS